MRQRVGLRHRGILCALLLALVLPGCAAMFDDSETDRQERFKSEPEDYSYNAKQYYHDQQYPQAKDQWEKQLEADPSNWMARLGVGYCDLWIGILRARSGDFERAHKQTQTAEVRFRELWNGKDLEKSTESKDGVAKANWKAALGLALCIRGQGWLDELETRTLRQQLDGMPVSDPARDELQPKLGKLSVRRDKSYRTSFAIFERLSKMEARSPEVVRNYGELALILGEDALAEELLREYLGMAKTTFERNAKLKDEEFSELFPTLNAFQAAAAMMDQKLDSNASKRFTVLDTLGALAWQRGEYQKALTYLDEASQLRPDRLDLLVKKAQCHGELRNWGDGVDLLDEFIRSSARSRTKWSDDVAKAMRLKQEYEDHLSSSSNR